MNILVAGGAGFIGSNLCASLIKDGHKVVILDNLSTGSLANIRDLEYGTYTFVNEDVRTCDLGGIISIAIDVIINLACIASRHLNDIRFGNQKSLGLCSYSKCHVNSSIYK